MTTDKAIEVTNKIQLSDNPLWLEVKRLACDYEKQIAELEQKLEQTEKDLSDYQFNYPTIKELQKENAELKEQIEKMKCCENCGWFYLQQHWRESKEINESRMFHCGTCGNRRNWKLREIKEND